MGALMNLSFFQREFSTGLEGLIFSYRSAMMILNTLEYMLALNVRMFKLWIIDELKFSS